MASLVFSGIDPEATPRPVQHKSITHDAGGEPTRRTRQTLPLRQLFLTALEEDQRYFLERFEDFRAFNATVAILLSCLASILWVFDYICNPALASQTVELRALFPLVVVPYVGSLLLGRSTRLSVACYFLALIAAQTLYVEILLRIGGGIVGVGDGFLFFLLAPFLMAGSFSLRLNLLSLLALSDWPLVLSVGGFEPGLNWGAYCSTVWPAAWLAACGLCSFSYIYRMNYKYQQRLLVAATTDAMTGVANRRRFCEALAGAINRARRYHAPLALIALDIDHFKNINDRWGHETGDRAICHVVALCGQAVRDVDLVGRMGGEEFTILLPETDSSAAITVAERVRSLLHNHTLHADDGTPIDVTSSFGIASYQDGDIYCEDILRRADTALYQAKHEGRDRVVEFSGPAESQLDAVASAASAA